MFIMSDTVVSRQLRGEKVKDAESLRMWNRKPYRTKEQKARGIKSYRCEDGSRSSGMPVHTHPMPKGGIN